MNRLTKALVAASLAAPACVVDAEMSTAMMEITSTAHLKNWIHRRSHQHKHNLQRLMHNMTVTHAMELLHKKHKHGDHSLEMVQQALHAHAHGKHKKSARHLRARLQNAPAPSIPAAVKGAIDEINKMIAENQEKYDLELHKCCQFDEVQSGLIETARQDIALFNSRASGCRQEILTANGDIGVCENKLPELDTSLKQTLQECSEEKAELRAQLKIIIGDLSVMSKILAMVSKCDGQVFLQRCAAEGEAEHQSGCSSFVALKSKKGETHEELQAAMQELQSDSSKEILHDHLSDLMEQQADSDPATDDDDATTAAPTEAPVTTWSPNEVESMTVKRRRPCKAPFATDKRTVKCAIGGPDCKKLAEKFLYIEAGIQDKKEELEEQLSNLEKHCEFTTNNIRAQIGDFESKLRDAQTRLAEAIKCENQAFENSRLKGIELVSLNDDYSKMTKTCHVNYQNLEGEDCGLKKIRAEVVKLESTDNPAFYQDCIVSDWVPGECSVSCGGGVRALTREITTPKSVGGAACPVLTASEDCNKQECPVDCILEDWNGWSACTAKCGGGVTERQRMVRVEPLHGGEPCGETVEATSCNMDSCDKDCELHDWTAWTECSKECDGGVQVRFRHISEQAVGDGQCPSSDSIVRMNYMECNNFACKKAEGEETLICRDQLDVVLLIDGSGSIGSAGWLASKKAANYLVDAFKGDSGSDNEIAVVLYSADSTTITHFTNDFDGVKTLIGQDAATGMQWPASYTKTGKALDVARQELQLGRADAQSIVIVLTDGRPMSTRYTEQASKNLRRQARLMWVPVTRYAPLADIKKWASHPLQDNIVKMDSFDELQEVSSIDEIIADSCKHVH